MSSEDRGAGSEDDAMDVDSGTTPAKRGQDDLSKYNLEDYDDDDANFSG